MADEPLTDAQVISVLKKMDVEQRTLAGLWGQFSIAVKQAVVVVERFQDIAGQLPDLEAQKRNLDADIASLNVQLDQGKRKSLQEETAFKAILEAELLPLRQAVTKERERAVLAAKDADDAEQAALRRKAQVETDILAVEARLGKAVEAFEAFKLAHGLS